MLGRNERPIPYLSRDMLGEGGWQSARYLVCGAFCALANNALLIIGASLGLGIFQLTLLSFLVIGTAGYVVHAHFTFRQTPRWRDYVRFMAGIALGTPLAYAVLALLCNGLHIPMLAAAPITTIILFFYNYLSARLAIKRCR